LIQYHYCTLQESFIPILFLIGGVWITKNIIRSLLISLLILFFIIGKTNPSVSTLYLIWDILYKTAISQDFLIPIILIFLVSFFSEISHVTGIANAYRTLLKKKIESKRGCFRSILLASWFFFLDDFFIASSLKTFFFSILSNFSISPLTFGYIISSTASSISSLIPISTWGSLFISQLTASGEKFFISPQILLFKSLPYFAYPLLSIVITWSIFWRYSEKKEPHQLLPTQPISPFNVALFFVPHNITLWATFFTLLPLFTKKNSPFLEELQKIHIPTIMMIGLLCGILLTTIILRHMNMMQGTELKKPLKKALKECASSSSILLLSWFFAQCLPLLFNFSLLQEYIQNTPIIIPFLPAIFFIGAILVSITMGSSWGTIVILSSFLIYIKIAEIIAPIFGAIVSGSLLGTHLTPISDTITAASIAASCDAFALTKKHFLHCIILFFTCIILYISWGFLYRHDPKLISIGWTLAIISALFLIAMLSRFFSLFYETEPLPDPE